MINFYMASSNKKKDRLDPHARQLILENSTVNRIKGEIDYANAFLLRSFKLSLQMEMVDS
jgi:hypothetical protein